MLLKLACEDSVLKTHSRSDALQRAGVNQNSSLKY